MEETKGQGKETERLLRLLEEEQNLDGEALSRLLALQKLDKLKLIALAEDLGSVKSLIEHPATMTHLSVPVEEREKIGITDSLVRISIGIENADDLIEDLEAGLSD